jgi:hypothetical protein
MIVADLYSNLGNQLFAYAATKTIALDLGYEYRYRVIRPSFVKCDSGLDDYAQEYESNFEKFFSIDVSERIQELPGKTLNEWRWERTPDTNYIATVYNIPINTHLTGYFLSPKYFEHRRQDVLKWFRFHSDIKSKCEQFRAKIVNETGANHLVAVHIRCGKFYRKLNMVLDSKYQINAINYIKDNFVHDKVCFLLFSDVPSEAIRMLGSAKKGVVLHHGNMFEDLCMMTLCDSHIVANSTFSWWGAWLAESSKGVKVRPSIWPIDGNQSGPQDVFPASWMPINSQVYSSSSYEKTRDAIFSTKKRLFNLAKKVLRTVLNKASADT